MRVGQTTLGSPLKKVPIIFLLAMLASMATPPSDCREQLRADVPNAGRVIEYMDTKHHPPALPFPILVDLLARKYGTQQPAVIIASDNNALDFITTHRRRLFPGAPVVFCGINIQKLTRVAGKFADLANFIGIHDCSMAQFAAELGKIPGTGIVLHLGFHRDKMGAILYPHGRCCASGSEFCDCYRLFSICPANGCGGHAMCRQQGIYQACHGSG